MRMKASCSAIDQNGQQEADENADERGRPVWGKGAEGHAGRLATKWGEVRQLGVGPHPRVSPPVPDDSLVDSAVGVMNVRARFPAIDFDHFSGCVFMC